MLEFLVTLCHCPPMGQFVRTGVTMETATMERIIALRDAFSIEDFVETGTYLGATALWAAGLFRRVATIELSPYLYQQLSPHYSTPNVRFVLGDSRNELPEIVAQLTRPAIFWLDGHWSAGNTAGEGSECHVLEEIRIVLSSPLNHLMVIDNAIYFESPPPPPHNPNQWPTINEVLAVLAACRPDYITTIIDDVIWSVPPDAGSIITKQAI